MAQSQTDSDNSLAIYGELPDEIQRAVFEYIYPTFYWCRLTKAIEPAIDNITARVIGNKKLNKPLLFRLYECIPFSFRKASQPYKLKKDELKTIVMEYLSCEKRLTQITEADGDYFQTTGILNAELDVEDGKHAFSNVSKRLIYDMKSALVPLKRMNEILV